MIKDLVANPAWAEMEGTLKALVNVKRRDRDALDPNDPEQLKSHGERALYMTGYIHGAEYLLNHIAAMLKDEEQIRIDIKDLEKTLNKKKRGGSDDD